MVLGAQKFPPRCNFTFCKKKASVGELAVEFWMEYADALVEAGSGNLRCGRAGCGRLSCRFGELCGAAKKTVTVTSWMEALWWS